MSEQTSNQTNHTVWYQLFKHSGEGGGLLEAAGGSLEIDPSPKNVSALCKAVKAEWGNRIECVAAELQVYKPEEAIPSSTEVTARQRVEPGTAIPIPDRKRLLDAWDPVPTDTKGREPLIVTAPAPQNPLQLNEVRRIANEEFDNRLAMLRLVATDQPERTLSNVSKSHALSFVTGKGRVTYGHDFFFELVDAVDTDAFTSVAPALDEDENAVHHPYFLREAAKLVDSAVTAGKMISQQILWTKSGQWLSLDNLKSAGVEPDFCMTNVDVSRRNTDGTQFYLGKEEDGSEKPSKYDVTVAFEQKKRWSEVDQIEAIDYGERLLRIQRGRQVAYTALFHCCGEDKSIRWMKVSPASGHYETQVSRPASLRPTGEGHRQLLTMLTRTSAELGRNFPDLGGADNGETIKISFKVGHGATSVVFEGLLGDREGVLKVMNESFVELADHEAWILNQLSSVETPHVPVCTKPRSGVLFFRQLLQPITKLTKVHVVGMLDCLKCCHSKVNIVHRDIRPDNIMETATGDVCIIDWGFAHKMDPDAVPPVFQGTFRFASAAVLDAAIENEARHPQPHDDLESFVRVVFAMGNLTILRSLREIQDGDFLGAKRFWERFMAEHPRQLDMFEAAAKLDYVLLEQIVV